jgi:hypothetical protein
MRLPFAGGLAAVGLLASLLQMPAAQAQELAAAAPSSSSGAPIVGLQVGHWQASLLPQELAELRENDGAVNGNSYRRRCPLVTTRTPS